MARLLIPEVFEKFESLTKKEDKVKFLKENNHPALQDILRINFDADVVSVLPLGAPPYEKDDAPKGHSSSSLFKLHRQFKYFFKGPFANQVQPIRREGIFLNILESIHPTEADVLVAAKDRKLKVKGLTKALVDEAFPGLIVKAVRKTTTQKKEK
tara:strand:+ start:782 stop:1246 length:465 start_codon:yes stop_codon:yes gene_type:complete